VNTANKNGVNPLRKASQNGHHEVVRELLKHGAYVNAADKYGFTPHYMANINGRNEVLVELLKNCADLNTAVKKNLLLLCREQVRVGISKCCESC
jgi:serine/threonine-protein phosphatase 6 regulatory ankyrin repeat subunit B